MVQAFNDAVVRGIRIIVRIAAVSAVFEITQSRIILTGGLAVQIQTPIIVDPDKQEVILQTAAIFRDGYRSGISGLLFAWNHIMSFISQGWDIIGEQIEVGSVVKAAHYLIGDGVSQRIRDAEPVEGFGNFHRHTEHVSPFPGRGVEDHQGQGVFITGSIDNL